MKSQFMKFTLHPGLIIFYFLFVLLSACWREPESDQLNLVLYGDPKSLDPAHATDVRTGQVIALLYDNLVRFGRGTELIPSLAKSWSIDPSGIRYRFDLRTDVKFIDGSKFTSRDVKSSFQRLMAPETGSHRTWLFKKIRGVDKFLSGQSDQISGFLTVDDSTFVIQLAEPFAPFLGFLAMPSASIVRVNENDDLIGTGPWILTQWVHDGHLLFKKNPFYFDGEPLLDALKIRILPEALPRSAEFVTGYLDVMEIPEPEYDLWANDSLWSPNIHLKDELNTYYIGLNCSRPPFDDVRVRQAVNYAVNIPSIIQAVNHGKGIHAAGPVPPSLLENESPAPYIFNTNYARQLIIEAGYGSGIDVELWQGQAPELMLITEAIQSQLAEVGVRAKIIRNDWNMFSQAVVQGKPDMYYRSWWADYPDAENFLAPLFESKVSLKRWTRYENPELDKLIMELQMETDEKVRHRIAVQANQILHDEAPWIYLWHSQTATIVNPNLQGWQPSLMFNAEKYVNISKN